MLVQYKFIKKGDEMFCNHKYGKVEDGYQYCEKCGKATLIGLPEVLPCQHYWKVIKSYEVSNRLYGNIYKHQFILQCDKCGEIKNQEL
jgi:hypothetical protein